MTSDRHHRVSLWLLLLLLLLFTVVGGHEKEAVLPSIPRHTPQMGS
jgi:hypothetical protein